MRSNDDMSRYGRHMYRRGIKNGFPSAVMVGVYCTLLAGIFFWALVVEQGWRYVPWMRDMING